MILCVVLISCNKPDYRIKRTDGGLFSEKRLIFVSTVDESDRLFGDFPTSPSLNRKNVFWYTCEFLYCVFYVHVFSCVCISISWYMCTVYIQCVLLYFYLCEDLILYLLKSEDICLVFTSSHSF